MPVVSRVYKICTGALEIGAAAKLASDKALPDIPLDHLSSNCSRLNICAGRSAAICMAGAGLPGGEDR